ncbi:MAG: hypothetical protein BA864_03035 [Desulfuromonadales bacterium C00003093]|nr:MAG: hypothetical protein BA864_03035 [Desulfuromonadales bacterium C00003093]
MKIDYSLKNALAWRFIVVSILPLLILSSLSLKYFTSETERSLVRENRSIAESVAAQISLELQEPLLLLHGFTQTYPLISNDDAKISHSLNELIKKNSKIEAILLLDNNRRVVAQALPENASNSQFDFVGRDLSLLPQVKNISQKPGFTWSKATFSDSSDRVSLVLSWKFNEFLLISYIHIEQLCQRFAALLNEQPSHLLLLDNRGKLLFQFPRDTTESTLTLANLTPVKVAMSGEQHTAKYVLQETTYLGTAVAIPSINWLVLFGQDDAVLTNVIWEIRLIYGGIFLLVLLLASLWARSLSIKIVQPISDLAQSAESFSQGDYQCPLPYGNHREIDKLSDSFRAMRQTIDEREKLLVQNQNYFSRLFNGVADAILISRQNPDGTPGKFIEVNDVACQMLGYSREEFLKLSSADLNRLRQEEPDTFQIIQQNLSDHEKTLFKTSLLTANGDWLPVEIGCQLFELDGRLVFFSVARDITLRENYETSIKTLVRSTVGLTGQQCLDEIVENLCDWLGADGASIGISQGDCLQVKATCLAGQLKKPFSLQLSGTPYAEILAGQYVSYNENTEAMFPALRQFDLSKINSFVGIPMIGHDGRIIGVVSAFSRTSMIAVPHTEELLSVIASRAAAECERMDHERQLAQSEEMLRTLFNSTAEAIVGLDLDGNCIFCNPSTLRILGYENESELIGQSFYRLVDNQQLRELTTSGTDCPFMAVIENEETVVGADGVLLRRDGQQIPVEYWGHRMMQHGQAIGGVITFIDISRRRTLEQQLRHSQRMEAIGTLTGGIAHDFNNILTVISGYAGLLQSLYANDEKLLPKISKIAEAAERGSKLTHGLLAYSRKKTGFSTPIDLNHLVLQVQDFFGKVIGEHIEKRLVLSEQPLFVLGDNSQIEQVLVNLATNARDAMPGGGILTMKTAPATLDDDFCKAHGYGQPGEYALVSVEDTGEGIPKEVQQKIFDPFFTTKDTGKGTGLGLAIAYGITKQHKGYIIVDSTREKGACFNIYLPLTTKRPLQKRLLRKGALPGGDETIMLVEDDPQVLETTWNILTSVGYKVVTSSCAEEALKTLDSGENKFSLILSDVVMPGMKGSEFYLALRQKTDIPIVFISGYTFDTLRDQGLVAEEITLLSKPISPLDLLSKLREIIDKNGH